MLPAGSGSAALAGWIEDIKTDINIRALKIDLQPDLMSIPNLFFASAK
jgi:hypothetical protein